MHSVSFLLLPSPLLMLLLLMLLLLPLIMLLLQHVLPGFLRGRPGSPVRFMLLLLLLLQMKECEYKRLPLSGDIKSSFCCSRKRPTVASSGSSLVAAVIAACEQ